MLRSTYWQIPRALGNVSFQSTPHVVSTEYFTLKLKNISSDFVRNSETEVSNIPYTEPYYVTGNGRSFYLYVIGT